MCTPPLLGFFQGSGATVSLHLKPQMGRGGRVPQFTFLLFSNTGKSSILFVALALNDDCLFSKESITNVTHSMFSTSSALIIYKGFIEHYSLTL